MDGHDTSSDLDISLVIGRQFYYYMESRSILNKNILGNTFGPMKSIVFEFSYSYNQGLDYNILMI